jgi:hypothetical protein
MSHHLNTLQIKRKEVSLSKNYKVNSPGLKSHKHIKKAHLAKHQTLNVSNFSTLLEFNTGE